MSNLKLNKEVFDMQAVNKAKCDYKQLAKIQVEETKEYIDIEFIECKYGERRTMAEFENYVIEIMNVNGSN